MHLDTLLGVFLQEFDVLPADHKLFSAAQKALEEAQVTRGEVDATSTTETFLACEVVKNFLVGWQAEQGLQFVLCHYQLTV